MNEIHGYAGAALAHAIDDQHALSSPRFGLNVQLCTCRSAIEIPTGNSPCYKRQLQTEKCKVTVRKAGTGLHCTVWACGQCCGSRCAIG